MSVLEEFYGTIGEYEYQKKQEKKRERKRKRNAEIVKALEDVRAEIKNIPISEERDLATYWDCRDDVLEIIDRKVKEIEHE